MKKLLFYGYLNENNSKKKKYSNYILCYIRDLLG